VVMLFHRHVWTLVKQWEQPSPIEIMRECSVLGKFDYEGYDEPGTRQVIAIMHCDKCGSDKIERI
jgi:hypothetical protein